MTVYWLNEAPVRETIVRRLFVVSGRADGYKLIMLQFNELIVN